jgi:hypothetical protein
VASGRLRRNKSIGSYLNSLEQTATSLNTRQNFLTTGLASGSVSEAALSEELTIANKTIQTENFVEGYSGWRISGNGDAEFGSVIVRGDINAYSGTIGYWNISTPAVSRVIGPYTLLGTFIESSATGSSDVGTTSGTYVGLYKSYSPEEILVTSKSRTSNVSTLTAENHQFVVGDYVIVSLEDDTTFNNGFVPTIITDATNDTFSYANTGSNVSESDATGVVQLYNPDVAGLYLRDYGKREFDYGYFSSTGVAYVAAETLNLVYNPSFEFTDINTYTVTAASTSSVNVATYTINYVNASNPFVVGQKITIAGMTASYFNGSFFVTSIGGSSGAWTATVTATTSPFTYPGTATGFGTINSTIKPSVLSWDTAASGTVTSWSFISSALRDYATASSYGGAISWTNTVPTTKFRGTIGYGVGDAYKVFDTNRSLHFSYDAFLNYRPFSSTVSSFTTTSGSVVTIVTSGTHGLSVDDIVYLDFTAKGSTGFAGGVDEDWTIDESLNSRLFKVLSVPSTTSFTITNIQGATATAGITLGSRVSRDGLTTRTRNVYKVVWPVIDLSEVVFQFPNATTTSLYSVLNTSTKAEWDADPYYKYKVINPNDWMLEFLDPVDGIPSLVGGQTIIDGTVLRSAYATNDNTNFLLESDIKVQIPIKTYSQTFENGNDGTYTSTTGTLHTSKASITSISYGGGYLTFTAANNFAVGDYVTVTGASHAPYNVTNLIIYAASSTSFTVQTSITGGTTSTANAVANGVLSTVIDQVLLSTEPVAFFGDTSASFYWKDETLNSPSQVSVQEPKKWIDIDLSTQTGTISNLDYIGFKAGYISHPMFAKPSISTVYDSSYSSALLFDIYDYEEIRTSSGIFKKADVTDTTIVSFESYSRSLTGDKSAMSEMVSTAYTSEASVRTYAEYFNSRVVIKSSFTHFEGAILATNIYPNSHAFGAEYGYHDTPLTDDGALNIYGSSVNIGDSSDAFPTDLSVNGNATFEKDATVNGISYLGEVETTGTIQVNTDTALYATADTTQTGMWLDSNNSFGISRNAGIVMYIKRVGNDGTLVSLNSQGVQQGSIAISGTTVSYNTFLGSHYSEMVESAPLKGTIVESINDLVENRYNSQERMPKVQISGTVGSNKVYGVYLGPDFDEDDQQSGHLIAAVGAAWVRIASGVSVQPGDLIKSNGDGCGIVQSDDIIRSSTVCKITSNVVVDTYEDGSYLVPCVLYCG